MTTARRKRLYYLTISDLSGKVLHTSAGVLLHLVQELFGLVPALPSYGRIRRELERVDGAYCSFQYAPTLAPGPVEIKIIWNELTPDSQGGV